MTTNNKTIKINTEYFTNIGGKTKKNREKQSKLLTQKPIINPNSLKRQLLNRVKEHKNREKKEVEDSKNVKKEVDSNKDNESTKFSDELYESMNYLSILSKKHKEDSDKKKYEKEIEKKRESIMTNKTLKNYESSYSQQLLPFVELELPEELKEPITQFVVPLKESKPEIKLNYSINDDIPYGCMKGGIKPTYKSLNNITRRANIQTLGQTSNQSQVQLLKDIESQKINERSKKLESIKQKLKRQEELNLKESQKIMKPLPLLEQTFTKPLINNPNKDHNLLGGLSNKYSESEGEYKDKPTTIKMEERNSQKEDEPTKKFIKRTIKRKYTLGKSKIYKKVGILIKDKNTRKNIITANKELKRKSMNEVKNYLKRHGLLKVGSNAPNDVLRKTYESSILTGDVMNLNKDILLHNFLNDNENE